MHDGPRPPRIKIHQIDSLDVAKHEPGTTSVHDRFQSINRSLHHQLYIIGSIGDLGIVPEHNNLMQYEL